MKILFRKLFLFALVVMTLAFILSACAPVASAYVQLDPSLADWIVYGVTALFAFLLMKLAADPRLAWLARYLGQYRSVIIAWFSGVLIQLLQAGILDKIPQMWDNVVTIAMQLIVAVIVTLYSFRLLSERGVTGLK